MLVSDEDKEIISRSILSAVDKLENKEIYLFGCTPYAKFIKESLYVNRLHLSGIIDNSVSKVNEGICVGVKVVAPDYLRGLCNKEIVVVIASKYYYEMRKQLEEYGYSEKNIFTIYVNESLKHKGDSYAECEKAINVISNGYEIYKKIIELNPAVKKIFVCPYPGTGDIYMACLYLPLYVEKENIDDYVVVVIGEKCKKVCELFSLKEVISLDKYDVDCLIDAWQFLGSDEMLIKPLLYWGWRCKRYLYADDYPQISFNEMFLYDVFDLRDVNIKLPNISGMGKSIDKIFSDYNLIRGRTILLAPYAGSFVSEVNVEIWKRITDILVNKGYTVCTNCFGKDELPVDGTKGLALSYGDCINFLNYAGGFIGIRSGLCDIISSSSAKQLIIYECGINAAKYEYFSLNKMGLGGVDKTFEIKYGDNEQDLYGAVDRIFG